MIVILGSWSVGEMVCHYVPPSRMSDWEVG